MSSYRYSYITFRFVIFFFFKQKTAYEMRISDWSSDVCSSDLREPTTVTFMMERIRVAVVFGGRSSEHAVSCVSASSVLRNLDPTRYEVVPIGITPRSEERRVGKECVSTCRSRWSPAH